MDLSVDQQIGFDKIVASVIERGSKKFFLTGDAGTGKSTLVKELIKKYGRSGVAILGSTGIAALNIGGKTIHSFSGINPYKKTFQPQILDKNMKGKKLIVVDEVSMCSAKLLEQFLPYFEEYGVTILFVGDFLQLPPVKAEFAFTSKLWKDVEPIILTTNHRQKDKEFIDALNDIRYGRDTKSLRDYIDSRILPPPPSVMRLYSTLKKVEMCNYRMLKLTGNPMITSMAKVVLQNPRCESGRMYKGSRIPQKVDYSIGSRIMMLVNDREGKYANGTLGTVMRAGIHGDVTIQSDEGLVFSVGRCLHEIHDANGKVIFSFEQLPFVLGYSCSVHKSQGLTFDQIYISLENHWIGSLTYVGLSRCKTPAGLFLEGDLELSPPDKKALDYMNSIKVQAGYEMFDTPEMENEIPF